MDEIFKNITADEMEKFRMFLSMMPTTQRNYMITLRVFIDEYENIIQNNKSASYLRSVKVALNYLVEYFSTADRKPGLQKPMDSIALRDVENFLIHLQHKVKKGYVVYFRNVKAAFNKAKEWGYVSENFFIKVKLPKRQKLAPAFITSYELQGISDKVNNEIVKDVVVFAFYTGMRLDEIVNLRWKNIDLQNGVITVGDEEFTTKGRRQRFIPISEEVLEILVRRKTQDVKETPTRIADRQACVISFKNPFCPTDISLPQQTRDRLLKKGGELLGFVFCKSDGKKFTGDYFSRRFKRACRNAGMEKSIHFHSLRHSFASNLAQRGISLYTIKELLGHSSVTTTEIYSHLNMDTLREAIGKLDTSASSSTNPSFYSGQGSELRLSAGSRYEGQGTNARIEKEPPLSFGHLPLDKRENSQPKIFRINSGEK